MIDVALMMLVLGVIAVAILANAMALADFLKGRWR